MTPALPSPLPELLLMLTAIGCFLAARRPWPRVAWPAVGLGGVAAAGLVEMLEDGQRPLLLLETTALLDDPFGSDFGRIVLVLTGLFLLMLWNECRTSPGRVGLVLMGTAGLMLTSGLNDLTLVFLAAELVSVCCLAFLHLSVEEESSERISEAGDGPFRPFAAEAHAGFTAALLFALGLVLLSGLAGSTELSAITDVLHATYSSADAGRSAGRLPAMGVLALVFITAAAGWRMGIIPFSQGRPELAERVSPGVFGWVALVQRLAGFVLLVRIPFAAMSGFEATGALLLLVLSAATLVVGAMNLWRQERLRGTVACLGNLQAGIVAAGLAVAFASADPSVRSPRIAAPLSAAAMVLLCDQVALAGIAGGLTWLRGRGFPMNHAEELAGLGRTRPIAAASLSAGLLSLAGLPLLAGFWGRVLVLTGMVAVPGQGTSPDTPAHQPAFLLLAMLVIAAMLATAAVVLRLLTFVLFDRPIAVHRPSGGASALGVVAVAAAVLVSIGVLPGGALRELARWESVRSDPADRLNSPAAPRPATEPRSRQAEAR